MDQNTPQDQSAGGQGAQGAQSGGTQAGKQYNIPSLVLEKHGELVEMIKKTESMSDEEREYWFQILPIMTDEQVARLRTILDEEAKQLSQLDKQYQDELAEINKKHLAEWDAFEKKKEREALQAEEAKEEAQEKAAESALLEELDDEEK